MKKRLNAVDQYFNEVIWYGGFPMRKGDVIILLDKVARSTGQKNWLSIRDAGLLGSELYNSRHPMPPGTEPITREQFCKFTGC